VPHLHNSFLQLAAERGLPALAAYLAMTALAMAAAWRGFAREGRFAGPRADLWLGALLAVLAFNLAGLFENNWGDTEVQRLALFALAVPFCLAAGEPAPAARPPAAAAT
jgi:O-antigen ligase